MQSINRYEPGLSLARLPYFLPKTSDGEVKTFEELACASDGIQKIAMFKADVDNLGAIFSFGMGRKVSISRYASLNRMLNYFFSTYLNHEISSNPEYQNIYTVFSGGDDLCLIGPWTTAIEITMHIRQQFDQFVGNNLSITLSAGLILADHKQPVRSIAVQAEEHLDRSKYEKGKNRITLFGATVTWEKYQSLINLGEELYRKIITEEITSGLVYRLIDYGMRNRAFMAGDVKTQNAIWRSHFRYDVARNIKMPANREWFVNVVEKNIGSIQVIASYALYKHRRSGGK